MDQITKILTDDGVSVVFEYIPPDFGGRAFVKLRQKQIVLPRVDLTMLDEVQARTLHGYCGHERAHIEETDPDEWEKTTGKEIDLLTTLFNYIEDIRIESSVFLLKGVKEDLVWMRKRFFDGMLNVDDEAKKKDPLGWTIQLIQYRMLGMGTMPPLTGYEKYYEDAWSIISDGRLEKAISLRKKGTKISAEIALDIYSSWKKTYEKEKQENGEESSKDGSEKESGSEEKENCDQEKGGTKEESGSEEKEGNNQEDCSSEEGKNRNKRGHGEENSGSGGASGDSTEEGSSKQDIEGRNRKKQQNKDDSGCEDKNSSQKEGTSELDQHGNGDRKKTEKSSASDSDKNGDEKTENSRNDMEFSGMEEKCLSKSEEQGEDEDPDTRQKHSPSHLGARGESQVLEGRRESKTDTRRTEKDREANRGDSKPLSPKMEDDGGDGGNDDSSPSSAHGDASNNDSRGNDNDAGSDNVRDEKNSSIDDFYKSCKNGGFSNEQIRKKIIEIQIEKAGNYTGFSISDRVSKPDVDRDQYNIVLNKINSHVHVIRRQLQRSLQGYVMSSKCERLKKGRLNMRELYRVANGAQNVMYQETDEKKLDAAVSLVIDCSGSMYGNKIKLASQLAILFAETLFRMKVPFEAIGFYSEPNGFGYNSKKSSRECEYVNHVVYKEFNEPFVRGDVKFRFGSIKSRGANIDHEAIRFSATRLFTHSASRKLQIVLCDGKPNGCGGTYGGYLTDALKETNRQIAGAGIQQFAFGLRTDCVKYFYPDHAILYEVEDLLGEGLKMLTNFLLGANNRRKFEELPPVPDILI